MNSYELIMKDIKATISKYLECKMIVNPLFAEKKCNDFSISSNHNQTGIQKDAKFSEVYQNICNHGAVFATGVQKAYPVKAAVRHPYYHFSISQSPILHKLPGDDIFIPPPGTYTVIIKLSGKFCKNHSRSFIFLNPSVMS